MIATKCDATKLKNKGKFDFFMHTSEHVNLSLL